ncbi:MAG TPA: MFS transporter [Candidatus Limnocylindrales bacterium]|nr:MFS transporter [Candidatus Limnocylindrales bacterium]
MTAPGDEERLLTAPMLGIALGAILSPLNSTMLAVALPSVMDEFSVDAATVASLVTLYLASVAITLPASGSIGDRFGHRGSFLVGVAGFGAASLLAATAASFPILALSRVLQAVSGALVSTSSTALVRAEAPPTRRGAAFGLFDSLTSISAAVGPLIGGVLVAALGWRSLFLLAVPISIVAVIAVARIARPAVIERVASRPIDILGLVLLGGTIVAALIGIRSPLDGSIGSASIASAVVLGAAFIGVELRSDHPAVDPQLIATPTFAAALAGVFGMTVILHGCFLVVPLLIERLQGGSAATTGLVLLGISAFWAIAAPFGGRRSDRVGRRKPAVIGAALTAIGLGILTILGTSATWLGLALLLSLVGTGMGLAGSPRQTAAMEAVGPERVGMAAGTYYTGRYLGGVVGASVAGAVLGTGVTADAVSLVFLVLAVTGALVTLASFGLPGDHVQRAVEPSISPT